MHYTREDACRAWMGYASLNPNALEKLLAKYGCYEDIYDTFVKTQGSILLPYANDQQMQILTERSDIHVMHVMMMEMLKNDINVIAKDDAIYPYLLRQIPDAPPLMYYKGDLRALQRDKYVTIVGSRNASPSGLEATRRIARDLSRSGVVIVSGLAVGVDAAAHAGCLDGGSPTIGVAACGLDVNYPADNALLKRRILDRGGLLLSETPMGEPALRWRFPVRNRILSGLSSATVMMEARTRSGTITTIQHALDQGREVYAYSPDPKAPHSEAAHDLLRDGAKACAEAGDILRDLNWMPVTTYARPKEPDLSMLDEAQKTIYLLLRQDELSFDQLAAATGYDAPTISGALTMLQIYGFIQTQPGKMFKIS